MVDARQRHEHQRAGEGILTVFNITGTATVSPDGKTMSGTFSGSNMNTHKSIHGTEFDFDPSLTGDVKITKSDGSSISIPANDLLQFLTSGDHSFTKLMRANMPAMKDLKL